MQCPKCEAVMEIVDYKGVEIDRCTDCKGLWFDLKEEELLQSLEGAEVLDEGDGFIGARYNQLRTINCPRCEIAMFMVTEAKEGGISYESCPKCYGAFFDAGEFTDYLEESIVQRFAQYKYEREHNKG